ncbi:hypothetical protein SETIT_4G261000v2 [Setaria italica]|uniref:Uncharacterized protein n=1 Tax=Setaria italica TaxID=4555 RepID=A0A368QYP9_SETIT|nr:hypothetical protein SETIT_4G261000v2 [Setaria italica]
MHHTRPRNTTCAADGGARTRSSLLQECAAGLNHSASRAAEARAGAGGAKLQLRRRGRRAAQARGSLSWGRRGHGHRPGRPSEAGTGELAATASSRGSLSCGRRGRAHVHGRRPGSPSRWRRRRACGAARGRNEEGGGDGDSRENLEEDNGRGIIVLSIEDNSNS